MYDVMPRLVHRYGDVENIQLSGPTKFPLHILITIIITIIIIIITFYPKT